MKRRLFVMAYTVKGLLAVGVTGTGYIISQIMPRS